jgi:hypothetical protein
MASINKRTMDTLQPSKYRDVFAWDSDRAISSLALAEA